MCVWAFVRACVCTQGSVSQFSDQCYERESVQCHMLTCAVRDTLLISHWKYYTKPVWYTKRVSQGAREPCINLRCPYDRLFDLMLFYLQSLVRNIEFM